MKRISRIAIGAAVVMLLVATVQPVDAACATTRLLNYNGAYIVSNPGWEGAGSSRTCQYPSGCYLSESGGPPISASIVGVFWGFDTTAQASASDPPFASGIDNGSWVVTEWTKSRILGGADPYYYPAWLALDTGTSNSQPGNNPNWGFTSIIDGCPVDIDPDSCTCVLLTDQWDGIGYFMADSAITDAGGNYLFDGQAPDSGGIPTITMMPTPVPEVTASERDPDTGDVTLMVTAANITGTPADYRDTGCDCNLGFLVYQQIVGRGGMAPVDRIDGWTPATDLTGGVQVPTALGGVATVKVDCDLAVQQDMYLGIMLVEENGLVGGNVSANSFRIECGAQLAEPNRPDRERGRSADAPRGRDENRGQRQR